MAHTLDTNARIPAAGGTSTANPLAQNYTCGAGTTVLTLMLVYQGVTNRAGGAPTYNAVAMTQAALTQGVTECSAELWYLLSPPTGSALSLSIPNTGGLTMCGAIASGKAAASHTSVLDEADSTETTGSNPISPEVTCSVAGDILFAVVATGDQTFAPTARTGTSLYEEDITSWGWGAQYMLKAGTGNQNLGWTEATEDDYGVVIVAFKEEGSSPSASPSEGTPSASPSEGTPSASPSEGTPSASPSEGTPSASPSEGTPSGSPSEGTPSASPSEGTPSGSPSEGTPSGSPSASPSGATQVVQDVRVLCAGSPSASPSEGTPSASPSEGTPSASPSEGTPSASPSEGTPSASPSEGTPSASPSEGTPSGSPSEGTPSASPSEGTPSASPSEGTPSASPSEGTPSGSPSEGTPSASPSEGTPSASPSEGTPSASPSEGTPSASPSEGTPSASPSEGTPSASPSEATPSASPSEGTPSASPSEGTPSASPSFSPSHSPSASPSEGTPSATPSASPSEGTPSASPSEGTPSASPSPSPSASPSEEPECRPIHYGPQIEPVGDPIPTAWDGVEPIEGPMPIEGIFTYDADLDEPTTAYPKPHYGQREGPVKPLII